MNGNFETQKIKRGGRITKMRRNDVEDGFNRDFRKNKGKKHKLELKNSRRFKNKRYGYC